MTACPSLTYFKLSSFDGAASCLNLIDWFTSNQMKANPDKFQAIAIGKNAQSKNISFNLNGNFIETRFRTKMPNYWAVVKV
jgi:hypothetical protein